MARWKRFRSWRRPARGAPRRAAARAIDAAELEAIAAGLDAPEEATRQRAMQVLVAAVRSDPGCAERVRSFLADFIHRRIRETGAAPTPPEVVARAARTSHRDEDLRAALQALANLPAPAGDDRAQQPGPCQLRLADADLRELALQGLDLRAVDLRRADLSAANLAGARLRNTNLQEARLHGADLRRAELADAVLAGADLGETRLRGADLHASSLDGADLSQAGLEDTDLGEAQLVGADLRHARLRGADLRRADLRRADLRHAGLQAADLSDADLRGTDLEHAELWGTNLAGANLEGADLRHAELYRVRSWESIRSLRAARIGEVVDAPDGFIDWATRAMQADPTTQADPSTATVEEPMHLEPGA
jgi:uncharacterized protein YjbI with pentapeptide repeats